MHRGRTDDQIIQLEYNISCDHFRIRFFFIVDDCFCGQCGHIQSGRKEYMIITGVCKVHISNMLFAAHHFYRLFTDILCGECDRLEIGESVFKH